MNFSRSICVLIFLGCLLGEAVAANGSWSEPALLPHAANAGGVITVDMKPSSAALVTVARRTK